MKSLIAAVLCLILTLNASAQLRLQNSKLLPKLKNSTTYVAIGGNYESLTGAIFKELLEKTWTYSKLEFISPDDLPKYYNAENSFLTVSYIESAYYTTKNAYGFTAIELSVWFCSDKWLKKKNGNPYENRQSVIDAHLKHTDDYEKPFKQEYPNLLDGDDSEYKISGRFWAPGVFKNFIQRANRAVEEGKDFGYGFPFIDKEQLKKLKTDTLFMPKWIETAAENTDLLSKYPYPYAFISYKKLNNRILYSKTPFYYVNFMEAKLYRVVSVINGQTGEVVFAKNYLVLNSFRKGDLEDIADAIPKK